VDDQNSHQYSPLDTYVLSIKRKSQFGVILKKQAHRPQNPTVNVFVMA